MLQTTTCFFNIFVVTNGDLLHMLLLSAKWGAFEMMQSSIRNLLSTGFCFVAIDTARR
jgi:hypothetical protein